MTDGSKNILLTGGTGFLGKALLALLVDEKRYQDIYLIVRPRFGQSPEERVSKIIGRMFPAEQSAKLLQRVHGVPGDLTEARFGLSEEQIEDLSHKVHQLVHIGASTDFGAPIDESRLHNVEGTRHALDLAVRLKKNGVFERFDYVSTAFVAGCRPGVVREDELDRSQDFSNNYERSKYEAEQLVRSYFDRLKIAIYRPSIVVGDSQNGYTPHFKVLYWPLQLLSKNLMPFFPCNKKAKLDVVPVDYVVKSMIVLMQDERSLEQTFYLTAGLGQELVIRNLLSDAYKMAGIKKRPSLPFWFFFAIKRSVLARYFDDYFWKAVDLAMPYYRYLKGNGVYFDSSKTQARLAEFGVSSPAWDTYKGKVLGFCQESRWGKKLPMAEHFYYARADLVRSEAQVSS